MADGYASSRVVKVQKDGNYLTAWGEKGNPPNETRPSYFTSVHGFAVDAQTGLVFVNDRNNRIRVFGENGNS